MLVWIAVVAVLLWWSGRLMAEVHEFFARLGR
jgi:hypothetical protein